MSKLKRLLSPQARVEKLRVIVSRIAYSKGVEDIPDLFADVLDAYDRAPLDPTFRADVHHVLTGALKAAQAMLDPAIDAEHATCAITDQIVTLSHIISYLSHRPTRLGYSILSTATGSLLGQFTTETEAQQHLAALNNIGHAKGALVVPIKIVSQFAIQPSTPEPLTGALPAGILPTHPSSELDDVIVVEGATNISPGVPNGKPDAKSTSEPTKPS